ncbi:RNA polymerase sigma factor [Pedobacter duraquae]|uniref:RNA polymerase sigma-70 factor (ECF subfamily) n=1 Tax=Pedobacter duraquae TaxID=425511 RepID=A0A4R6IFJ5_9SPHI|nr:sigma-70 family RNA polymerase sigma factor [Pedobacter duraquae]TDO20862.1 RNA polymerase sigma-70 factor (ECF subfamily) [Pedobacter duraquae]
MEEKPFLQLISDNQRIIDKICRLYRDTKEDRRDLFQEIVFQLWQSIDSFRGQSKPSTFIYRVAINTALTSFRKDKTKKLIDYTDQLPEMANEPEDRDLEARTQALIAAVKKLSEPDRAIMALLLDDLSYREIAEITGTSENNIAVKISRIKDRIRKILKI